MNDLIDIKNLLSRFQMKSLMFVLNIAKCVRIFSAKHHAFLSLQFIDRNTGIRPRDPAARLPFLTNCQFDRYMFSSEVKYL